MDGYEILSKLNKFGGLTVVIGIIALLVYLVWKRGYYEKCPDCGGSKFIRGDGYDPKYPKCADLRCGWKSPIAVPKDEYYRFIDS